MFIPAKQRIKTKYPGVYYIESQSASRKTEKIFYIMYRKDGKLIEEKAVRQFIDDMTPARAAGIRALKVEGKQKSNRDKREVEKICRWTIEKLWDQYRTQLPNGGTKTDISRYELHFKKPFTQKEPKELVKLDTDRLRINLLKKRSPQTVKHVLALLRRIINFGADQGLITPLPFKITIPSVDNIKTEDLTPEQLQNLLSVLDSTHLVTASNMMRLVLFSGLRRGEIFKLKWTGIPEKSSPGNSPIP